MAPVTVCFYVEFDEGALVSFHCDAEAFTKMADHLINIDVTPEQLVEFQKRLNSHIAKFDKEKWK